MMPSREALKFEAVPQPASKRGQAGRSKYAPLANGEFNKLYVDDWGFRTEEKAGRAFRSYCKSKGLRSHVWTSGKGFITVNAEKPF